MEIFIWRTVLISIRWLENYFLFVSSKTAVHNYIALQTVFRAAKNEYVIIFCLRGASDLRQAFNKRRAQNESSAAVLRCTVEN